VVIEFSDSDRQYMQKALTLAKRAGKLGEVPVGALLVDETGRLMGSGYNRSIAASDPTAHAEMNAMRQAAAATGNYRLTGSTLYVTLEPCPMCAGALVWARIKRVVFGAYDPKAGALGSTMDLAALTSLNHHPEILGGLMADECAQLLKEFFAKRRKSK
jgi:tRNA(adenine34) deaminase